MNETQNYSDGYSYEHSDGSFSGVYREGEWGNGAGFSDLESYDEGDGFGTYGNFDVELI